MCQIVNGSLFHQSQLFCVQRWNLPVYLQWYHHNSTLVQHGVQKALVSRPAIYHSALKLDLCKADRNARHCPRPLADEIVTMKELIEHTFTRAYGY